jgi:glyoxylase-like metal-dependent hydrolase (beta-lactamase superfamily II)
MVHLIVAIDPFKLSVEIFLFYDKTYAGKTDIPLFMEIFTINGRNYDSNIFVLIGNHPAVIDTGTGIYEKEILRTLQKFIQPTMIEYIVLTHEHYDHVGGVTSILTATGNQAKVVAHKNTVEKLKAGKSDFARLLGGHMPKISIDLSLSGSETFILGDESFDIIYTPGHSKGSISLFSHASGSLFSGDTVFAHGDFGRYDLPGGNLMKLHDSIKHLASLNVKDLYPGHGPVVEGYGKDHVARSYQNIQTLI